MREGKHELAIKHYNASLSWLKLMFEEKIFTNEKEALLFVQKIGVNIKYNSDSLSHKYFFMLFYYGRMEAGCILHINNS